ncbi:MAG: hypothetical protein KDA24_18045 [Deltaproteobacteria bacterium]|nr:hypothetical protein [Deltaproteobacteria bacterium]
MNSILPDSSPVPERPPVGVRLVALLASVACTLSLGRFADPAYAIDDAWISFRTARTWLETGSLTFDGSMPPVEGVTNFLWTMLSASWVSALPDVDPIGPARILGALLLVWTVWRASRLAGSIAERAGGDPVLAAGVTGALLAASGSLAFHALSGLETALWGALFLAICVRLDRLLHEGGGALGLGVLLALLGATRPEGVLVAGLLVGALLLRRETRPAGTRALAPIVLGIGALEVFRLLHYGSLVPNTFAAKPPDPVAGLRYLAEGLLYGCGVLGLGFAALVPRRSALSLLGLVLAVLVAGAVWSGGDWMPGARRLTLPLLWLSLAAGVALGTVTRGRRRVAAAGVAAWLVGNLVGAGSGWDAMQQAPRKAEALARAAQQTEAIKTVALADVGVFGWDFDRGILDLVGLTDAHVAGLPGAHGAKEWDEDYFRRRSPELVLVRSESPVHDPLVTQPQVGTTERPVLFSILDHGGYRYHATVDLERDLGRYLLIFSRTDVELPEALWGPPAEKDLRELLMELDARSRGP